MSTTEPITPQISIIVPARNEESCLADCLQSLATQTGVSFEIIVVDDQSTDRTRAIALSFPSVQVIEAGPSTPRLDRQKQRRHHGSPPVSRRMAALYRR